MLLTAAASAADGEYESIRDTLTTCFVCHGENGSSGNAQFPVLAGQHLHYLYVQLKDYKSGLRANPVMGPLASSLEKDQMLLIAQYFSEQPWPDIGHESTPEKIAAGKSAAVAGQCVQCHRGGYEGDSRIPRVAGQHEQYLQATMQAFKTKARNNSPSKSSLMTSFTDEDIDALADYLAGFEAPK